ncbi:MAG: oxidoreductase [Alphaproteobacteria bacterium]|nr:oxidoreductase [Alphaproteobacteria bacterium]
MTHRAIMLEEEDGKVLSRFVELEDSDLPDGDVTIAVSHSTVNYKDGMILNGLGRLVRDYPHVPGVDLAGTVIASDSADFAPGDAVLLTGYRHGEIHWGGYAQKTRVPAEWLIKMPDGLTPARAMAVGTAGFTSMQCIMALESHGLAADKGEVLVTGAAGGVGSVAVAILANLGYAVAASTGRAETHDFLKGLGATTIVDRAELAAKPDRPLLKTRWAGAIDTVGSTSLAHLLAEMDYGASVAACGLAGGSDLDTTVLPFLLRAVNLLGIDSVNCTRDLREQVWRRISTDLPMDKLDSLAVPATLDDVPDLGNAILKGQIRGRAVVEIG